MPPVGLKIYDIQHGSIQLPPVEAGATVNIYEAALSWALSSCGSCHVIAIGVAEVPTPNLGEGLADQDNVAWAAQISRHWW